MDPRRPRLSRAENTITTPPTDRQRDPPFDSAVELALLFALPGALQGGSVYHLAEALDRESLWLVFAMVLALLGPPLFWLCTTAGRHLRSALFATLLGATTATLVIWSIARFGTVDFWQTRAYPYPLPVACAVAIAFIALPFWRSALEMRQVSRERHAVAAGNAPTSWYASLFAHAWNQTAAGLLGGIFAAVALLLVLSFTLLFSVIGIDLDKWLWQPSVLLPIAGAAFATAVGVVRERESIMLATRQLLLALLHVLLPFQLVATAAFVGTAALLGIERIETGLSVTAILLVSAGLSLSLCSAWIGDEEAKSPARGVGALACRALALLVLPLASLAAAALWPRVAAYGWTHDRVAAATAVTLALCYGIGYAVAALTPRFAPSLRAVNIVGAVLTLVLAVLLLTPLLDGYRIGAASQLARLSGGEVDAADIDLGWLKFRAGRHGREALASLAASPAADTPPLSDALHRIERIDDLDTFEQRGPERDLPPRLAERIAEGRFSIARIVDGLLDESANGETAEVMATMAVFVSSTDAAAHCLERALRCVLLLSDEPFFEGGGRVALLAMTTPEDGLQLAWLRRRLGEEHWGDPYGQDHQPWAMSDYIMIEAAERNTLLDALARGEPPVRTVERRGLAIGGRTIVPGAPSAAR